MTTRYNNSATLASS